MNQNRGSNGRGGSKWIRKAKRIAIYMRDGWVCVYCGRDCREEGATLDHVVPRSRGGTNHHKNLVTACLGCNSSRRGRPVSSYGHHVVSKINRVRARKLPLKLVQQILSGSADMVLLDWCVS